MMESTKVVQGKQKLSAQDRLTLIQTLNALPRPQFDELVFALNPPNANVPGNPAFQGDRSKALLEWAESPVGPGLLQLEIILGRIIATHSNKARQFMAIVIKGEISSSTTEEVRDFVQHLKQENRYKSIDIEFFTEGSIKIVLSGSLEELARLQELLESGTPETPEIGTVADVYLVDNSSTEAKKAQFIQTLKMRKFPLIKGRDIASAGASARIIASTRDQTLNVSRANTLARDLVFVQKIAFRNNYADSLASDLTHVSESANNLVSMLTYSNDTVQKIANDLAFGLSLTIARNLSYFLASDLIEHQHINLTQADLSGANLKDIDLRGADLTNANLTNADVTGTIFGSNQGLTEEDKQDLERRGAIFQNPPSSNVPSLVLR